MSYSSWSKPTVCEETLAVVDLMDPECQCSINSLQNELSVTQHLMQSFADLANNKCHRMSSNIICDREVETG